jgi:hypothetical protein
MFLNYESDQSRDDMHKFKVFKGGIFFPSSPEITKSVWEQVCAMKVDDFRKMRVGVYDTEAIFQSAITKIDAVSVEKKISFIRAAMNITSTEKKEALNYKHGCHIVFPSDDHLAMFAKDPEYFASVSYSQHSRKLSFLSSVSRR